MSNVRKELELICMECGNVSGKSEVRIKRKQLLCPICLEANQLVTLSELAQKTSISDYVKECERRFNE